MKVDRKIASIDAALARITNDGSNLGTPRIKPRLTIIHAANIALPAKRVIASATRSERVALASSRRRRCSRVRILLARTGPKRKGLGASAPASDRVSGRSFRVVRPAPPYDCCQNAYTQETSAREIGSGFPELGRLRMVRQQAKQRRPQTALF
jgi:hypothetical protein